MIPRPTMSCSYGRDIGNTKRKYESIKRQKKLEMLYLTDYSMYLLQHFVVIVPILSSLAAPEVVAMTSSAAANDDNDDNDASKNKVGI